MPDGVCCVSALHSPPTAGLLLPAHTAAEDVPKTCFPPGFLSGALMQGTRRSLGGEGKKEAFSLSIWLCSCGGSRHSAGAQGWLRLAVGECRLLGFCQVCRRGPDNSTLCTLSNIFSLCSFRSGGGNRFRHLLIFGKSYLPSFSPLLHLTP